uniref:Phosphoglycolate phosphatase n=2 Tax=Candidatus Methanogaster sp. ANME-2c ERB4 TaxID=2759911 RepID=A0A7G9YJR1_9EURY|nr:phosphoglycolate phosphatase [Methanosarcinales archaeon ANME-2c ERB4]QNO42080.1 phosphoglycolate phosphatase [Methanosarcinales archaeon ANME-2c ERB4]QNO42650.1 phosphoglycolate phosphatase [Methanosarcinales archaeon ANME-2c ERB4]QNO48245.1 phosphoglycolate phosphatase [Methanosarcinales archaeon ANME-2c ERB4]
MIMMEAYILDLDGVIFRGSEVIAGAPDAVNRLLDSARVVFLTNNSTQSREAVSARLNASGIRCRESDVITAGYAAAVYIRKRYGAQKIYPIGEAGLIHELKAEGHKIDPGRDGSRVEGSGEGRGEDAVADFVVVGLDRDLTYEKLRIGLQNILAGAGLIATNTDPILPVERGFLPGAGAIVRALEMASGRSAFVIGKPNPPMMDAVIDHLRLPAHECMLVGDRLETDILAGSRYGMKTVLVLSGVETAESVRQSRIKPDAVIGSIAEMREI